MMDSFELTKIAAAVLAALLIIVGVKTAIDINLSGHGGGHEAHAGFTLPMPTGHGGAAAASAASAPAFDAAKVAAAAATGDAKAGQDVFKKCSSCHTIESGGANKTGPNLHAVVGRAKASAAGFGYSDDIKGKGGNWSATDLATFLHDPKGYAKGTKMAFAGVKDSGDLANLIAYLSAQK